MTSLSGLMTRATVEDKTTPGETMLATAWQGKQKIEVRHAKKRELRVKESCGFLTAVVLV